MDLSFQREIKEGKRGGKEVERDIKNPRNAEEGGMN